jgi:monoamine oxidase
MRLAAFGRPNSFVKIAEALNFEINRNLPPWRERAYG